MHEFQSTIWNYYRLHKRSFPWRETTDPYHIFISEVCLQQTQTSRVVQKYQEILTAFPTVNSLSEASFPEVLRVWVGLGYNRRAKYLHESAKLVVEKYNGIFPNDPVLLDELPGVGYNTAAAVCVYSFNSPLVFIETNIRRIFIHHFFSDRENISDQELMPFIESTLDKNNPREWYWALMDYGSFLPKVIKNPNRRSAHYSKQTTFEGSSRQVRANILKVLLNGPQTQRELKRTVQGNLTHFDHALTQLVKEGLVLQIDDTFSLQ